MLLPIWVIPGYSSHDVVNRTPISVNAVQELNRAIERAEMIREHQESISGRNF
jgi:hypothetical protein